MVGKRQRHCDLRHARAATELRRAAAVSFALHIKTVYALVARVALATQCVLGLIHEHGACRVSYASAMPTTLHYVLVRSRYEVPRAISKAAAITIAPLDTLAICSWPRGRLHSHAFAVTLRLVASIGTK